MGEANERTEERGKSDEPNWLAGYQADSDIYAFTGQGVRRKLTSTVLERMNLPRSMWGYRPSDIPEDILSVVRPWVNEWQVESQSHPSHGLLLYGDYPMAEKVMAVVLMSIRHRCFRSFSISAMELNEFVVDQNRINELIDPPLLGLHCFGGQYVDKSGFAESNFARVLNSRSEWGRPTVIASRYSPEEILKRYAGIVSEPIAKQSIPVKAG